MSGVIAKCGNYFWISFLSALVVLFVSLVLWTLLCFLLRGFEPPRKNWPLFPLLLFVLLVTPTTTLLLAGLQVFPPTSAAGPLARTDPEERQADQVEQRADQLRKFLEDPQSRTIAEIEAARQQSLELSRQTSTVLASRGTLIAKLREEVRQERAKAEEATRLARETQSLKRSQLEAIKLLITEDAKAASKSSVILATVLSLPIGMVSSLIASWIFRHWGARAYLAEELRRSDRFARSPERK